MDKDIIFRDSRDYHYFVKLLHRYFDGTYQVSRGETVRPSYADELELLAYCLMPNHFHFLIYQMDDPKSLEKCCRSLMTAYVKYYNKKYQRVGPLFQGRYKARVVDSDPYLYHISRYIHLNPLDIRQSYKSYPYSSYRMYAGGQTPLIKTQNILGLFNGDYLNFVDDYAEQFLNRTKTEDFDY